ncbi:protein of unknown function [Xenorhabdus poinarii G6]|uniref:Uncharacterized protein n=1 Tax=Xenorhabdus poinarii G6 TaxID=1354304 RepID=A0A068R7K5_9GAMM|nr:protein of unknown function [Xenorhabdus poinarii G6]
MFFFFPNNGNLIIEQGFLFAVILLSDENIDDNSTITFYNIRIVFCKF